MCEQCGYFDRYADCNKPADEFCPAEQRHEKLASADTDDNFEEEELEVPF